MSGNKSLVLLSICFVIFVANRAAAQLLSPMELKEPLPQKLQQRYWADLKLVAVALEAHSFPFPFYFSRTLDIDEEQQRRLPQGSIRFERHEGQTVVAITGNYYASYSSELMSGQQRVKQALTDVLLPLLRAAVPPLSKNDSFSAYALEISYHVRRKILGVNTESPENLVLLLPVSAAKKLIAASNTEEQQSAILDGTMFVDGEPFALWLSGDTPPVPPARTAVHPRRREKTLEVASLEPATGIDEPAPTVSEKLVKAPRYPVKFITQPELATLQSQYQPTLEKLRSELQAQAHFVAYAPPSFVEFRRSAELQLSLETTLPVGVSGSQYKMAALAFDQHIAHLVRPVLGYFSGEPSFDGVDFSTTVRAGSASALSVEFILPLKAMRCFAEYECTGQQLINGGLVLINGERVALELQSAESER